MVAFAGYNSKSLVKYTYDDTISIALTLNTDATDFCGDKQLVFTVNGTVQNFISAFNSDYIYFSPPANTVDFGVGLATVQASMKY